MGLDMLLDALSPVTRIAINGSLTYFFMLFVLRTAGSRSLANTNVFDLIVTIGVGATFGATLLSKDISLVESFSAITLLILLQELVARLRMRSKRFAHWTEVKPVLLFFKGHFQEQAISSLRLTKDDILAAVRQHGMGSLQGVEAIVLEGGGQFSVIKAEDDNDKILPQQK